MLIEPTTAIAADQITSFAAKPGAAEPDFARWMSGQIGEVNTQMLSAQDGLARLATGETGNLHEVMLELSKAKLAFQLTVAVRNKVLEGYQDIMRMQI